MVPRIPWVKRRSENLKPKVLAAIFKKKCHPCMSIFQLPLLRCPCKDFQISWFLHPNNLCWRIFVKFFSKFKFRVYNAVSSLAIRVRKRVTRYNWHGNNLYAMSICHFCHLAKYSLRGGCHILPPPSVPLTFLSYLCSTTLALYILGVERLALRVDYPVLPGRRIILI